MGRVISNDARYIHRVSQRHISKGYDLFRNVLLKHVLMLIYLKWIHANVKYFVISYSRAIKFLYKSEKNLENIIMMI